MVNHRDFYRLFRHHSRGFTLVEVIIALALLGVIGVAFLGGLATSSRALITADERATAESLARSQMEYVKDPNNQEYIYADPYDPPNPGGEVTYNAIPLTPELVSAGYSITSYNRNNEEIDIPVDGIDGIYGVPWDSSLTNYGPVITDAGQQRIKLAIYHLGKKLFTLEDYKVDR